MTTLADVIAFLISENRIVMKPNTAISVLFNQYVLISLADKTINLHNLSRLLPVIQNYCVTCSLFYEKI